MHYRTRRAEPKGQDLHVLKFGLLAPNYRLDDEDSIDSALASPRASSRPRSHDRSQCRAMSPPVGPLGIDRSDSPTSAQRARVASRDSM